MPAADDHKVDLIRKLVAAGRGNDLRLILLGASQHNAGESSDPVYPESYRDSGDGFHLITWVSAHLEFTSEFGAMALDATRNGHVHFAHPVAYERWLSDGAPGLSADQVQRAAYAAHLAG